MSKINSNTYNQNQRLNPIDSQMMLLQKKMIALKSDTSMTPEEKAQKLKELKKELKELQSVKNKQLVSKAERETDAFQKPFSEVLEEKIQTEIRDTDIPENDIPE